MNPYFTTILLTISVSFAEPLEIGFREALLNPSYVLVLHNLNKSPYNLHLHAKNKDTTLTLKPHEEREFGWVQGYTFDANNVVKIWSDSSDTIVKSFQTESLDHLT